VDKKYPFEVILQGFVTKQRLTVLSHTTQTQKQKRKKDTA